MTIYEIKRRTQETSPFFFDRLTLKFFGQTLKDFRVKKRKDGKYVLSAPVRILKNPFTQQRIPSGETRRVFNPETNRLEAETK